MRQRGGAIGGTLMANRLRLSLKPDDLLFVALLGAWVLVVAITAYLLLGWAGAGAVITVAGLFGMGMIAAQSRDHRPQERAQGQGPVSAAQ
jgi:hypothetical protein